MTISEAITKAMEEGEWSIVDGEPTSVIVGFETLDGKRDETELDLYSDNPSKELSKLWSSLAAEMESSNENILYVNAYGYIHE